jgi:hypothetical protein
LLLSPFEWLILQLSLRNNVSAFHRSCSFGIWAQLQTNWLQTGLGAAFGALLDTARSSGGGRRRRRHIRERIWPVAHCLPINPVNYYPELSFK